MKKLLSLSTLLVPALAFAGSMGMELPKDAQPTAAAKPAVIKETPMTEIKTGAMTTPAPTAIEEKRAQRRLDRRVLFSNRYSATTINRDVATSENIADQKQKLAQEKLMRYRAMMR